MTQDRVLIKTAGRTGSHVIAQQEMERLGVTYLWHMGEPKSTPEMLYAMDGPCVLHDHTKYIPPDADRWDLIVSLRHNVYDQAISYCIARQTNNWGDRPADDGDFVIDDELFLITLKNFKVVNFYWELIARMYKWKSIRRIYWEDMLPLDREYTLLNYPAADRNRVVNHDFLREISQKYIDNHNWAIDEAADMAAQYIGTIGRVAARALLNPTKAPPLDAKTQKRLKKSMNNLD